MCRVFDDVDEVYAEWEAWYKPEAWLSESRALGAFIGDRIARASRSTTEDTV